MSQEIFLRALFSGIFSLVFAWVVFSRYDRETGSESTETDRQKYLPYIPGSLLPMMLIVLLVLGTFYYGIMGAAKLTLSAFFGIFLHICVYDLLLILALPLFRRHISARACAMLWVIPNYLYIAIQSFMQLPKPLFVISVPGNLVWIIFGIWLAGFLAVLIWKTVQHLIFRHHILHGAVPVTAPEILTAWNETIEDAQIKKPKFKLIKSPHVNTPLSVGLFRRKIRVVLPEIAYAPEELRLVLKHEVVHIAREDAWSKFFLVFCTAMCWFNPLMWIAMKKSAEDMELSCDETVLLNADENTRKKYASLLLDTAGDDRGFTTCLSASAKTMHYRLKSITKPAKRRSGALVVGAVFFLLCMTSGYVALAYGGGSGAEIIYQSGEYSDYHLQSVSMADDPYSTTYDVVDEDAFHEYLASLSLSEFFGNYSFSESSREYVYLMDTPDGILGIDLCDNAIKLTPLRRDLNTSGYYIAGGVDWDYLSTVIVARPALNVVLMKEGTAYGNDFHAGLSRLWKVTAGEKALVFDAEYPEGDAHHGIYGDRVYERYAEMSFDFSNKLAAPCSVLVESWDRSSSETFTQQDITQPFTIPLPQYSAHYTVYASVHDRDGAVYEAEYQFDLGEI